MLYLKKQATLAMKAEKQQKVSWIPVALNNTGKPMKRKFV